MLRKRKLNQTAALLCVLYFRNSTACIQSSWRQSTWPVYSPDRSISNGHNEQHNVWGCPCFLSGKYSLFFFNSWCL